MGNVWQEVHEQVTQEELTTILRDSGDFREADRVYASLQATGDAPDDYERTSAEELRRRYA